MVTPLWDQEPARVEPRPGRHITMTWDIETRPDGSTLQAVLHVSHAKAGINYTTYERTALDTITAGLRQQVRETHDGYVSTSFALFSGLRLKRWEDGKRFAFKRLQERSDEALAVLREACNGGDESVRAYFLGKVE